MAKWNRNLSMRLNDDLLLPVKDLINDIKAGKINIDDVYNQNNDNESDKEYIEELQTKNEELEETIDELSNTDNNDAVFEYRDKYEESEKKYEDLKEIYNELANKYNNLLNGNNGNVQSKEIGFFDKFKSLFFES